jgi:hypothetical protein
MAVTGLGEIAEKLHRSTVLNLAEDRGSGSGVISGPRLLRLEFLRGDYSWVRRVTLQLGDQNASRSFAAA